MPPGTIRSVIALIQRVSRAAVTVDARTTGEIGRGILALIGVERGDGAAQSERLLERVLGYRIFEDDAGAMNRSLTDVDGAVLVISQFTLYGDAAKGRRPSFIDAARPEQAIPLYEQFARELAARGAPVATGVFGAEMEVEIVNDGPVTLMLERNHG